MSISYPLRKYIIYTYCNYVTLTILTTGFQKELYFDIVTVLGNLNFFFDKYSLDLTESFF